MGPCHKREQSRELLGGRDQDQGCVSVPDIAALPVGFLVPRVGGLRMAVWKSFLFSGDLGAVLTLEASLQSWAQKQLQLKAAPGRSIKLSRMLLSGEAGSLPVGSLYQKQPESNIRRTFPPGGPLLNSSHSLCNRIISFLF